MLPLATPEAEQARRAQLLASRQLEATDTPAQKLDPREIERWQLLFAANRSKS